MTSGRTSRRDLLKTGLGIATGTAVAGLAGSFLLQCNKKETAGVSPVEDLMREHGLLKRVMLIYEEVLRRIDRKQDFPVKELSNSAFIIRNFIENYHEKLEEDYLFPRFNKAGKQVELTRVLEIQHRAGRRVTDLIIKSANEKALRDPTERVGLAYSIRQFNRMYAPHEAREDTVLFPAFRHIVDAKEYDRLGDEFEDREHKLFGSRGFEGMVDRVAAIEKKLGIYDLARFTPKI